MASFSRGLRWLVAAFREMNQTANKLAISTQAQINGNDMALLLVGKAGMDGTEYIMENILKAQLGLESDSGSGSGSQE